MGIDPVAFKDWYSIGSQTWEGVSSAGETLSWLKVTVPWKKTPPRTKTQEKLWRDLIALSGSKTQQYVFYVIVPKGVALENIHGQLDMVVPWTVYGEIYKAIGQSILCEKSFERGECPQVMAKTKARWIYHGQRGVRAASGITRSSIVSPTDESSERTAPISTEASMNFGGASSPQELNDFIDKYGLYIDMSTGEDHSTDSSNQTR